MNINKLKPFISTILIILLIIAIIGLNKLSTNANYKVYFNTEDTLVKKIVEKQRKFSLYDQLLVVIQSTNQQPLSHSKKIYQQTNKLLKKLKLIKEVRNIHYFLPTIDKVKQQGMYDYFLSKDQRHTLLSLDVKLNDVGDAKEISYVYKKIKKVIDNSYQNQPVKVYLSGTLALNYAYVDTVRHDLKFFIPGILVIILTSLALIFRAFSIPLLLLGIGCLSTVFSFGIVGWMGGTLAAINAFTPVIIIALSVVTAMHNIFSFYQFVAIGTSAKQASIESFNINIKPLTVSCLTTAIGFLLLSFSPSPPIVIIGYTTALGIMFSYLLIVFWLHKILAKSKLTSTQAKKALSYSKVNLSILSKKKMIIFTSFLLVLIVSSIGLTKLQINDNVHHYFPENSLYRQSNEIIDQHFFGISRVDYVFSVNKNHITDDSSLEQIEHFSRWLKLDQKVQKVLPNLKFVNNNNKRQPLQYDKAQLNIVKQFIAKDKKSLRLQIILKEKTSAQLLAFVEKNNQWLKDNIKNIDYDSGSSPDLLFAHLGFRNSYSMFVSLVVALGLTTLLIALVLKSFSTMIIAVVCNFIPIIIIYGLWGQFGGYITLGTAVVMGMIVGVVIDDTIHVLFKYRQFTANNTTTNALNKLQQQVFPVLFTSSLVLSLALSIGLFSDFRPINEMSLLSIGTIIIALVTDLYLLPLLLQLNFFTRKKQ